MKWEEEDFDVICTTSGMEQRRARTSVVATPLQYHNTGSTFFGNMNVCAKRAGLSSRRGHLGGSIWLSSRGAGLFFHCVGARQKWFWTEHSTALMFCVWGMTRYIYPRVGKQEQKHEYGLNRMKTIIKDTMTDQIQPLPS